MVDCDRRGTKPTGRKGQNQRKILTFETFQQMGLIGLRVGSSLDPSQQILHIHSVSDLDRYERLALELAEFTDLGPTEGAAARIPGFRGLIAVGKTRSLAKRELASALHEWISLALARGYGLPRVAKDREKSLIERADFQRPPRCE